MRIAIAAIAVVLATMTASLASAATLTLDEFDGPAGGQSIIIGLVDVGSKFSVKSTGLSAVGGSRTLQTEVEAVQPGGSEYSVEVNRGTTPGNYQLKDSVSVDIVGTIVYDADGALLDLDLSSFGGLTLFGVSSDVSTELRITLDTDGGGSSAASSLQAPGFLGNVSFLWGDFSPGANLANVDRITISVNPTRGGDVKIESFAAVPEPSSVAMLPAALVGLLLARGRRAGR